MISEQIEIFLDAANFLNFSEVAKIRYTTQPTISRQINLLEREWGVKLFLRSHNGLRLTAEGAIMLEFCKKIDRLYVDGLKAAKNLQVSSRDTLSLGFLHTFDIDRIFLTFIEKFSNKYPYLNLAINSGSFSDLRQGLEKDRYDIIYTLDFDFKNMLEMSVVSDELIELQPIFVISKNHPLFSKENLNISDCIEELFFIPSSTDSPGREKELRYLLNKQGILNGNIRTANTLESVLFQVKLGKGIALLDNSIKDISSPIYRKVNFKIPINKHKLVCIWKKDNLNPFVPLMINSQTLQI